LGGFALLYHGCLLMLLMGGIDPKDIETYFIGTTLLLLVHLVAVGAVFKNPKPQAEEK
jgi:hypothetical protein